ncbi:MAG TPA: hypothetical protein VEX11_02655, partial [Acetobacteraceae bacterium]|nr:hypothetical protein [Acetobacteraceae bacterium]
MQRRVFRIDGEPFVATRDGGGFFETFGTLLPLIGGEAPRQERGSEETAHRRGDRHRAGRRQGRRAGGSARHRGAAEGSVARPRQAGRLTAPRRLVAGAAARSARCSTTGGALDLFEPPCPRARR